MKSIADRLPVLTILEVAEDAGAWRGRCRFPKAVPKSTPSSAFIWVDADTFVRVRIETLDDANGEAVFTTADLLVEKLEPGLAYKWLNYCWGERAQLALDRTRKWSREEHQPSDTTTSSCPKTRPTLFSLAKTFRRASLQPRTRRVDVAKASRAERSFLRCPPPQHYSSSC